MKKKKNKVAILKRNIPLILMILPALLIIFAFTYLPKYGIILAFKDYNVRDGIWGSAWNGLENFRYIFSSGEMWRAVRNTLLYSLGSIAVMTPIPIVLAMMLFAVSKKSNSVYQFFLNMPYLISMGAIASVVYIFLRYDGGIVNQVFEWMGKEAVGWYQNTTIWPFLILLIPVWWGAGVKSIYYYSVFMGVDASLFEAIDIDGGTWIHKVRHCLLPAITPLLCLFLIQSFGSLLGSNFALHYTIPMDSSALYEVTEVLATYEYNGLRMGNIGTTTALGLVLSIVNMITVFGANSVVKKINPDNAMY